MFGVRQKKNPLAVNIKWHSVGIPDNKRWGMKR